jgi:hypothetical protein
LIHNEKLHLNLSLVAPAYLPHPPAYPAGSAGYITLALRNFMPTTDWNWFFSSVAQSAAAIVGIFGAFIVTKILANQSAFVEKSRRAQELITRGERISDESGRLFFDWYHKHDIDRQLHALEGLLEKDAQLEPEALYEELNFSPYISRSEAIEEIGQFKAGREHRLKRQAKKAWPAFVGTGDLISPTWNNHIQSELSKKRDKIDALFDEAKHHARVSTDFHGVVEVHPESSRLITVTLVLVLTLFFAGVIYPLSFMPLPTDWKPAISLSEIPNFILSLRGALLGLVSIIFTAMLAMFFVINTRMKYPQSLLAELEQFKHLGKYSKYFANREDNEKQ